MALLQISEPGQTPEPQRRQVAVGIDLGTTNSLVATVRSGTAQALPDEAGSTLLPSVVCYHDAHNIVVGAPALALLSDYPRDTLTSVKRFMGRGRQDIEANDLPAQYLLGEQGEGMVQFQTRAGLISPVQASAEILRVLAQRASATMGVTIENAVITVPAYFDEAQRQATKDAATVAGLTVLRLINEPTAAALAYGLDHGEEGTIAVFDLGGGTFDISILTLQRGVFEVLATGGDTALGGDDFDDAIVRWALAQLPQLQRDDPGVMVRLRMAARAAKEELTEAASAELSVGDQLLTLNRSEFDALVLPLVKRTIRACRRALRDAALDLSAITEVVLVGGCTRVPLVQEAVEAFFKRPPRIDIDPDTVVAIGAAQQADILVGNKPEGELLLLDVIPLSLGIETMGGLVEKLVPRNTTIPVAKAQEFTTYKDGQTALSVHVVQGERELVSDCRSLARFELRGIPPMVAGAARITVTYQVDADGLLSVAAREETQGVEAQITVKPSFGLSDSDITGMLKDSWQFAAADKEARQLAEEQLSAEQLLQGLETALSADAEALLSAPEQRQLRAEMQALSELRADTTQALALRRAVAELGRHSEEFAARRMDASIKSALAGVAIDSLDS